MSAIHAPVEAKPPAGVARYVPILQWLPKYQGKWLRYDAIAGLTVWAVLVPEAMAYAKIAGVPVQYGLYAAPLAGLAYMVFGSSQHLFFGPDAAPAAITATVVVGAVGAHVSVEKYVSLTTTLALITGLLFILFGLLRLGWISKFFAQPVLAGFVFGLGWFIAIGQLHKLVGSPKVKGDSINVLVNVIGDIGQWNWTTVAVGVSALVLLFVMARFIPRVPAALVVLILGILAVNAFDLHSQHGVKIIGTVPSGFHFVSMSQVSLHDIEMLIPGAFALLLVVFSQSVALAKTSAEKYHEPLDTSQELYGYGAASLGAGAIQGFTGAGSLSKSAVAQQAGARSPLNLGIAAVATVVTILFLTGLFKNLPEAVLAAIVIHAVSGAMRPGKLVRLWHANRGEFVLAALTAAGILVINILPGILIGVLASFFLLITRLDHPLTGLMGRSPDGKYFAGLDSASEGEGEVAPVPEALIYAFGAPLLFTNNEEFSSDLLARIDKADPQPKTVIVDGAAMSEIDTTGSDALRQLHDTLARADIRLELARVNPDVAEYLKRDGVLEDLGDKALFPTVREAVDAVNGAPRRSDGRAQDPARTVT